MWIILLGRFNSGNVYKPTYGTCRVDEFFVDDVGYMAYTLARANNRGWQTIGEMVVLDGAKIVATYDECAIVGYMDRIQELRGIGKDKDGNT